MEEGITEEEFQLELLKYPMRAVRRSAAHGSPGTDVKYRKLTHPLTEERSPALLSVAVKLLPRHRRLTVSLVDGATVAQLKAQVHLYTGVPTESLRFVVRGRCAKDTEVVQLGFATTLTLVVLPCSTVAKASTYFAMMETFLLQHYTATDAARMLKHIQGIDLPLSFHLGCTQMLSKIYHDKKRTPRKSLPRQRMSSAIYLNDLGDILHFHWGKRS